MSIHLNWLPANFLSNFVVYRLILSAILNAILENNEVADLFFETVTTEDSENVIGWTLYGMTKRYAIKWTDFLFSYLSKTYW